MKQLHHHSEIKAHSLQRTSKSAAKSKDLSEKKTDHFKTNSNQNISFTFSCMIPKGDHTLNAFPDSGQKARRDEALIEFLYKTSGETIKSLQRLPRQSGGFEEIPCSELNENITELLPFQADKIASFYFGGKKYRIAGCFDPGRPSLFYILGFDWNFTLYNHGS